MDLTPDQTAHLWTIGKEVLAFVGAFALTAAGVGHPKKAHTILVVARQIIDILGANTLNAKNEKGPE